MLIFSFALFFVSFVAFPEKSDAVFAKQRKDQILIENSGSLGLYYNGKCHPTYGNETITSDEYNDWCSNIASNSKDSSQNPWIQYSIKGKKIKVKSFSVRNGCCHYACCCTADNKIIDSGCCCLLYSFSLQASNDNKTWTPLYKVVKDSTYDYCGTKTYELKEMSLPYTFFRIVLDEEWPGCPKCMQINEVELYGESESSSYLSYSDSGDAEDESVSIIGRVSKNEQ